MAVHGTARFATVAEAAGNGLVEPIQGPFRGLVCGFWPRLASDVVSYNGDLHQLIVAGTGGGKFVSALAPMLLLSDLGDSTVVVVDPKGELAQLYGTFSQEPFAQSRSVFLLDPWDVCETGQCASLNVLATITPQNPNCVDDARAFADAIIIPSGSENTHWDNAGRNFLAALLLYVAHDPSEEGNRDLVRVRELVTLPWEMPKAYTGKKRSTLSELVFGAIDSKLADGAVKRGFTSILNREEKERSGIISSIERDTSWIDSPQMAKTLRGNSLGMSDAEMAGKKYFIVVPPDYFMTHRAWLRLAVIAFAKAFRRKRSNALVQRNDPKRWRHIIIDEFANLGEMSFIQHDVAVARGYDVKYHLVVQDLSQLRRIYKDGWESIVNNSFQRFFAVSDLYTAEYVSRLTGSASVESASVSHSENHGQSTSIGHSSGVSVSEGWTPGGGTAPGTHSRNTSFNQGSSHSQSFSTGYSSGKSVSEVQRPLMTPDEVRRIPDSNQLLFFRGLHPVLAERRPYWDCVPAIPNYTLKEVLGTVGRSPRDDEERIYFLGWREAPRTLPPPAQPAVVPELPAPIAAKEPGPLPFLTLILVPGAALALMILLSWLWPNPPAGALRQVIVAALFLVSCAGIFLAHDRLGRYGAMPIAVVIILLGGFALKSSALDVIGYAVAFPASALLWLAAAIAFVWLAAEAVETYDQPLLWTGAAMVLVFALAIWMRDGDTRKLADLADFDRVVSAELDSIAGNLPELAQHATLPDAEREAAAATAQVIREIEARWRAALGRTSTQSDAAALTAAINAASAKARREAATDIDATVLKATRQAVLEFLRQHEEEAARSIRATLSRELTSSFNRDRALLIAASQSDRGPLYAQFFGELRREAESHRADAVAAFLHESHAFAPFDAAGVSRRVASQAVAAATAQLDASLSGIVSSAREPDVPSCPAEAQDLVPGWRVSCGMKVTGTPGYAVTAHNVAECVQDCLAWVCGAFNFEVGRGGSPSRCELFRRGGVSRRAPGWISIAK